MTNELNKERARTIKEFNKDSLDKLNLDRQILNLPNFFGKFDFNELQQLKIKELKNKEDRENFVLISLNSLLFKKEIKKYNLSQLSRKIFALKSNADRLNLTRNSIWLNKLQDLKSLSEFSRYVPWYLFLQAKNQNEKSFIFLSAADTLKSLSNLKNIENESKKSKIELSRVLENFKKILNQIISRGKENNINFNLNNSQIKDNPLFKNQIPLFREISTKEHLKSSFNLENPIKYKSYPDLEFKKIKYENLSYFKERLSTYLKLISPINYKVTLAQFKNISYQFNLSNNKIKKNLDSILFNLFLSISFLISKPILSLSPEKIYMKIFFYFISPIRIRKRIRNQGRNKRNFFDLSNFSMRNKLKNKLKLELNNYINNNSNKFSHNNYLKDDINSLIFSENKFSEKDISKNISDQRILFNKFYQNRALNFRGKFLYFIMKLLNKIFKKPVELELIRLHYPFYESQILVRFIGKIINRIRYLRIKKKLLSVYFKNVNLRNKIKSSKDQNVQFNNLLAKKPVGLSGIFVKVAGRVMTQRVVPRRTVKYISEGLLAKGRVVSNESTRFTNKNKRGSYSITVFMTNTLN
jgi:hypothetical protein